MIKMIILGSIWAPYLIIPIAVGWLFVRKLKRGGVFEGKTYSDQEWHDEVNNKW